MVLESQQHLWLQAQHIPQEMPQSSKRHHTGEKKASVLCVAQHNCLLAKIPCFIHSWCLQVLGYQPGWAGGNPSPAGEELGGHSILYPQSKLSHCS